MRPDTYYRGVPGKKYGIWNCSAKCFQFNIREDTPMLAMARLHQKLGHDAKKWHFEPRMLPDPRREEPSKVTEKTLQALEQMGRNVHGG